VAEPPANVEIPDMIEQRKADFVHFSSIAGCRSNPEKLECLSQQDLNRLRYRYEVLRNSSEIRHVVLCKRCSSACCFSTLKTMARQTGPRLLDQTKKNLTFNPRRPRMSADPNKVALRGSPTPKANRKPSKYPWTADMDDQLRQVYQDRGTVVNYR